MYDAIIVGSGPAGVAAATALVGRKMLLLDVGERPAQGISFQGNFYEQRKNPDACFGNLIGERYESLNNISRQHLIPKLKSPLHRHIVDKEGRYGRIRSDSFNGYLSYARGGLANAWGAQLYQYNDEDLRGFPFRAADLAPYYTTLTKLIGISGQEDDLTRFYGSVEHLLPPLELNTLGRNLLHAYSSRKAMFQRAGIHMGRPRLGVLSVDYQGRKKCDYANLEFFHPYPQHIYQPSFTLDQLISRNQLEYRSGFLVVGFQEVDDHVRIFAQDLESRAQVEFQAKKMVLAAGTLGSAKIVLKSMKDNQTRLPIMENLLSYIPFLNFFRIGAKLETRSFYTQVNLFYTGALHEEPVMGTFYAISGILHSDILFDIPLPVRSSLVVSRHIIPAIMVLHLWYPSRITQSNFLRLDASGDLEIVYQGRVRGKVEKHLINVFRRAGYLSLPSLCKYPLPGNSFHYAGTLPMRKQPVSPYETDLFGRLNGQKRIHVVDGSCFPSLPAKNLSLTIMANSLRICDQINRDLDVLP